MGNKKKRGRPDLDELLARPWCYYCERDFDDLKVLIDHQRAKHFKCEKCGKRLNTAGGLSVHLNQVHKEPLTTIDNALPNRSNPDVEIFGTTGIPADVAEQHRQRVLTQYAQAEVERRAVNGNPASNSAGGENVAKKPKIESKEDIKKRMAEFKAKKAAGIQQNASSVSSPSTPGPTEPQQNLPPQQAIGMHPQQAYGTFPPQPYGALAPGYPPPPPPPPPPQTVFTPPQAMPAFSSPSAPSFAPTYSQPPPYGAPMASGFGGMSQYPGALPPGAFPAGPPGPYGAHSPPMPYGQQGQFPPPSMNSIIQGANTFPPGHPPSAHIGAPGLPQRPMSNSLPINPTISQQPQTHNVSGIPVAAVPNPASNPAQESKAFTQATKEAQPSTRKAKKEDKIRMVYSDNEVSPEEKMANLTRYRFERTYQTEEVDKLLSSPMEGAGVGPAAMGHQDFQPIEA